MLENTYKFCSAFLTLLFNKCMRQNGGILEICSSSRTYFRKIQGLDTCCTFLPGKDSRSASLSQELHFLPNHPARHPQEIIFSLTGLVPVFDQFPAPCASGVKTVKIRKGMILADLRNIRRVFLEILPLLKSKEKP